MREVVTAFVWAEAIEQLADSDPEGLLRAGGGISQQGLELGEGLLDGVQIRRVGRQVKQAGTAGPDGGFDARPCKR